MSYQDILEKNIDDAKQEYKQVVDMLSKIKGEYNDLLFKKEQLNKIMIQINLDFIDKSWSLQEIENKLEEYKQENLQDIAKIQFNYSQEIEALKTEQIKLDNKLLWYNTNLEDLNSLEVYLKAKELTLDWIMAKNIKIRTKIDDDLVYLQEKQESLQNLQEEIKRNLAESTKEKNKAKDFYNNTIKWLELREKNIREREEQNDIEKLRIADEWNKLKRAKDYLDNLKKNVKANI